MLCSLHECSKFFFFFVRLSVLNIAAFSFLREKYQYVEMKEICRPLTFIRYLFNEFSD
jgi:hypothetical protein